jgi:hypothetical protein
MRLLVCGGRDVGRLPSRSATIAADELAAALSEASAAQRKIYDILDALHEENGFEVVVTDGSIGAAKVARDWAAHRGLVSEVITARKLLFFAESVDSVRQRLFSEGKPDLVVSFLGGEWTEDIVETAKLSGLRVIEHESLEVMSKDQD